MTRTFLVGGVMLLLVAQQDQGPRVLIATPAEGEPLPDPVVVQALVRAQGGRDVASVDAYLNGEHLGTLAEEPFRWETPAPASAAAVIRVVAVDSEGAETAAERVVGASAAATFSAEVEYVSFNLSVTGRGRVPVPDLRPGEIELKDNGALQEIQQLTRTEAPLKIVLVLDRSGSLSDRIDDARRAVAAFVDQLEDDDQVMLIGVNHRIVTLAEFTRDHEQIKAAADGIVAEGGTALFDGLLVGLEQFGADTAAPGQAERRALLVFTDGADLQSRNPEQRVIDAARDSGITIYAVGQGDALDDGDLRNVLREIGRSTGGEAVFEGDARKLPEVFSNIATVMRGLYFVSYKPTDRRAGWHEIEVDVDRRGTDVRHRPGYTLRPERESR